ncbi:ABC-type cobalt transport system, permease component CbiQ [Sphaerochaeta pleomorpha str. Grapes]|uniref:ABC-type cobalt transport system, permease component CbiQ n=1 Tax=Sphaerochaeta pleomorpha (strain ATCC BAA-1885 / DSM 22778 / Grapes) TaxID=158190 RepID=G8QVB6_SPHPG|nr:energy-coupling factor transporter transmembrane component T [Sphaerochaeta pleomorpha]AEV30431.1 ABC-type cobalt transport system, permease component CbiQ [Sphaerochaeta pleomorpha str. Grapes]
MAEAMIFHFRDRKSFLNASNPVTKFGCVIALCFPLVKAPLITALVLLTPLILLALLQRLPVRSYGRELKFFGFMALLIALTTFFSTHDAQQAAAACVRFFAIILSGMLLADSTAPDDLARSLGSILERIPFVKGWEIASSIELTLSLVPIIFDVTEQVTAARKSRQARTGNPIRTLSDLGGSIFSLLLDRSEDLASALDARAFDPGRERQTLGYGKPDGILLVATILLVIAGYML